MPSVLEGGGMLPEHGFHELLSRYCEQLALAHDWEVARVKSISKDGRNGEASRLVDLDDVDSSSKQKESLAVWKQLQCLQKAPENSDLSADSNSGRLLSTPSPALEVRKLSEGNRSDADGGRSVGFELRISEVSQQRRSNEEIDNDNESPSGSPRASPRFSDNQSECSSKEAEKSLKRDPSKGQFVASNRAMVENSMTNAMGYVKHAHHSWTIEKSMMVIEFVASIVILLNSVVIGLSTDVAPGWFGWVVIDTVFAFCFVSELCIKICVLGCKPYFWGLGASWNFFDGALTLSAVIEVTISYIELAQDSKDNDSVNVSFFRVMRLVRIVKITRLARVPFLTELMMMLQGALGGAKTFMWSLVLISVPVYMVALVLRETLGNSAEDGFGAQEFSNIGRSFFTVFRCCVTMDCTEESGRPVALLVTHHYGFVYGVTYCFTSALFTFGLFNILTAIYVDNVVDAAKRNEALHKSRRMADADHLTELIHDLMMVIWDVYGSTLGNVDHIHDDADALQEVAKIDIDAGMFQELCDIQRFQDVLHALGIADEDRVDLFDTLDVAGKGTLGLHDMVMGIAKLRGQPRRSDIVGLGLVVRNVQEELRKFHASVGKQMKLQTEALRSLR